MVTQLNNGSIQVDPKIQGLLLEGFLEDDRLSSKRVYKNLQFLSIKTVDF
jgi:hypothetical protein